MHINTNINNQHEHINTMKTQISQLQISLQNTSIGASNNPTIGGTTTYGGSDHPRFHNPVNYLSAPRADRENDNKKVNDELILLGNNFSYDRNERKWIEHRQRLKNIFWSLDLNKDVAIRITCLSMTGKSLFMSDNVDPTPSLQEMNGDALKSYLYSLENIFISSASKELTRVKFNSPRQDQRENVSSFATIIKMLFSTAFPDDNQKRNGLQSLVDDNGFRARVSLMGKLAPKLKTKKIEALARGISKINLLITPFGVSSITLTISEEMQ